MFDMFSKKPEQIEKVELFVLVARFSGDVFNL